MTKRLKSTVLYSIRVLISEKRKYRVVWNNKLKRSTKSNSNIWIGFCLLKMIKCRRRQATDLQKLNNSQRSFSRFLLVEAEAEAIGVEAEAVEK